MFYPICSCSLHLRCTQGKKHLIIMTRREEQKLLRFKKATFGSITLAFIFKEDPFQGNGQPGLAAVEQPRMPAVTPSSGNLENTRHGPRWLVLMNSAFLVAQCNGSNFTKRLRIIPVTTRTG